MTSLPDRRQFLHGLAQLLATAAIGAAAAPAFAKDGESGGGDGGGHGGGGDSGGGDSGGGDSGGSGSGGDGGHGGGDDSGGKQQGEAGGGKHGSDQNDISSAVGRGDAQPLWVILKSFRASVPGEIVSVRLERRANRLDYRIQLIDPSGRLRKFRIDAKTAAILSQN